MKSRTADAHVIHGTFVVYAAFNLVPHAYRNCPVCYKDMQLYTLPDGTFWMCSDDQSCGFNFPSDWQDGDDQLRKLVAQRQEFLR